MLRCSTPPFFSLYPKDHWTLKGLATFWGPKQHCSGGSFTRNHWRVLQILRVQSYHGLLYKGEKHTRGFMTVKGSQAAEIISMIGSSNLWLFATKIWIGFWALNQLQDIGMRHTVVSTVYICLYIANRYSNIYIYSYIHCIYRTSGFLGIRENLGQTFLHCLTDWPSSPTSRSGYPIGFYTNPGMLQGVLKMVKEVEGDRNWDFMTWSFAKNDATLMIQLNHLGCIMPFVVHIKLTTIYIMRQVLRIIGIKKVYPYFSW